MAASVFLYHVVGDLTLGKPELVEFTDTETVEAAIRAIGESMEGEIPVWKRKPLSPIEDSEARQLRFVGILNSFDIVAFLAREECLQDQEKALKTPVHEIVVPNGALLKQVDPATRLIDALEMMKQGVRRLLVPKSVGWKGMSKRFSMMYNGKWLKNLETSSNNLISSAATRIIIRDKFCCLSREDVIRFLIGCLGALAPLPLSSISSLDAINHNYHFIEASLPALAATKKLPQTGAGPFAVAVVEAITASNKYKIIGEISSYQLWKCDYLSTAWALANLSAGQFVMGVEDNVVPTIVAINNKNTTVEGGTTKQKKFSSSYTSFGSIVGRSIMYRGRSTALTCKVTSTLAAVMAQMLSHRASHVWVTEASNEDVLVGVVSYADILCAVTRNPLIHATASRDCLS